ncbi:zinc finger protein 337-like isoform X6 [Macaca nemestrina]|uniref:zinc finger protein 337-like isoform X6 n=1 Tax=Macaca nemestrina TaxID=9545 RepID=UPI0039B8D360
MGFQHYQTGRLHLQPWIGHVSEEQSLPCAEPALSVGHRCPSSPGSSRFDSAFLAFGDVTVDFTQKDWRLLNPAQRALYREVTLENYSHLVSLGILHPKPELIRWLGQGEAPWGEERRCRPGPRAGIYAEHVLRPKNLGLAHQRQQQLQFSDQSFQSDTAEGQEKEKSSKPMAFSSPPLRHAKTHSGEKPFICSECGQGFIWKSNLVKHQLAHSGKQPFVCKECGRGFNWKGNLLTHQRTHSGEKPFVCNVCGQGFSWKRSLTRHHWRIHSKKPFVCQECKRGYTSKSDLTVHERIHTGERPYECQECGRKFSNKSYYSKHLKRHLREKGFCTGSVGEASS